MVRSVPLCDGHPRPLLLFGWQLLHDLLLGFLQLGIRLQLFHHARANAFAAFDLVHVLRNEHSLEPLAWKALDVAPLLPIRLDVSVDLRVI